MTQKRILFIDTHYPGFVESCPIFRGDSQNSYQSELRKILDKCFGTSDFYSGHFRALGWDSIDVIANHGALQQLWAEEHHGEARTVRKILLEQIKWYEPDVIFFQDLAVLPVEDLIELKKKHTLAGQCSCPMPPVDQVRQFDVLLTSFPHYVQRFKDLGISAHYLPLAFEDSLLNRVKSETGGARIHDIVFIGGVGTPSHWSYGMEVLEAVAREIPAFKAWGYGFDLLPDSSALKAKYQGPAWGLDMYRILAQSKIVLNRHGEVAGNFANNMRMFEATGMGAMLLTDAKQNLLGFFNGEEAVDYASPDCAARSIREFLDSDEARRKIAAAGQARTLRDHTYTVRMKQASEILLG